jgi:hypothetical protein
MITKYNLKELIQTIDSKTIQDVLNSNEDFILLECHTFNVGSFATIESMNYSEEVEASANGNLFMDKDSFQSLCDELEVFEY